MTQQDATVNVHVNNQEAEQKVKELADRARQLRKEFAEAVRIGDKGTIAKTEKDLRKVNKELNNATLRAARIRDAMKHLSQATPKELHNTLKLINQELNSGAVKRGSKEWKQYQEQIKQVNAELRKIQAESRETESTLNRANNFITKWGNSIVGGLAAMAGVTMAGKQAVQAYADMDSAMANTQKFTGMVREEVEELNEEFKKMDTRTSREGLNELAQAAGRLGKNSVEDVMGFVRAGDIIGVAMDELGADAPQIISQLAGIFNLEGELGTEKAMLSVGSAINTLSQNCAAGAPNLVDFASRMGAIANSTNMSMDEMLAFGALLDDQKVSVEKASTAMQGVITKMYADPATFAKKAGLNVQEFTDALKRSSTEGIMMFVDSLSKMDSMQQAATLKDLGTAGAGVVQTFQTLAGKTELLQQQMATSKQAFADATSATEEFNVQNNTVQAELDKAKKGFNEMAVELGEHLYPVMRYAISSTSLLMRGMKTLIEFVIENKRVITSLALALAAYTIVVKAHIIADKARMVLSKGRIALMAIENGAVKTLTIVTSGLSVVYNTLTGNQMKAAAAARTFSAACAATPIGALVAAIGTAIIAYKSFNTEVEKLTINYDILNNAKSEAAAKLVDEERQLKNNIVTIKNFNGTKSEEQRLIDRLNVKYGQFFGKAKTLKEWYDKLTQSGKDYCDSLYNQILWEGKRQQALDLVKQAEELRSKTTVSVKPSETLGVFIQNLKYLPSWNHLSWTESKNEVINKKVKEDLKKADELEKEARRLLDEVEMNKSTPLSSNLDPDPDPAPEYIPTLSDKELKKRKEEEEKRRKEEEKTSEEAIKKELAQKKAVRDTEYAENLSAYSLGQKNYLQYVEKKHQIDVDAIAAQKKVLEEANLTETQVYAKLLKKEAELKEKYLQTQSQLKKEQLDREHKDAENNITSKYLDPQDDTYSSEKSYRQALFELDVEYMKKKRDLYLIGSKEWEDINQEINDKIADDQLQKQQETAEALAHFQEEYGKASGSAREKMELDILDNLHKQGLITEEEYNRAVSDIRNRYQNEDIKKARTVQNEYADMVVNLYFSFKKFFDELGKEGTNFWANLSNASQAAYALMATALSQYSAYADAERDLELAQVEQRYDAEIEKAGKNTKKKEALEKEKEAKIAAIKKKHNDRAMKIEIAQAVAQTAMSAIAAYASAAAIPLVGWVMAPIAAALAVAAGAVQIATIKKQHQAEAIGYYDGGYTGKSLDNHKEVGVVHANEFVANHKAVANPRLRPMFNLLDSAQRNNTVGSLTANDVSNALGQGRGVTARAEVTNTTNEQVGTGLALVAGVMTSAGNAIDRLNKRIDDGIETVMIMDGERGFAKKYEHYQKLSNSPKR